MFVSWRKKGAIALSISEDGLNWSNLKIVLNKGEEKSWESIVNRACVLIFKNKFYMWYTGQKNGKSEIGLAISDNEENFIKYKYNPILLYFSFLYLLLLAYIKNFSYHNYYAYFFRIFMC